MWKYLLAGDHYHTLGCVKSWLTLTNRMLFFMRPMAAPPMPCFTGLHSSRLAHEGVTRKEWSKIFERNSPNHTGIAASPSPDHFLDKSATYNFIYDDQLLINHLIQIILDKSAT